MWVTFAVGCGAVDKEEAVDALMEARRDAHMSFLADASTENGELLIERMSAYCQAKTELRVSSLFNELCDGTVPEKVRKTPHQLAAQLSHGGLLVSVSGPAVLRGGLGLGRSRHPPCSVTARGREVRCGLPHLAQGCQGVPGVYVPDGYR